MKNIRNIYYESSSGQETPRSDSIVFSKLFITGPPSPTMPYIVLSELALEARFLVELDRMSDPFYYVKVFKKILKIEPVYIHDLNNKDNFSEVVHIINPLVRDKWSVDTLRNALQFITYFIYAYRKEKDFSLFLFTPTGLQTPENQCNINACIYYGIARFKKLHIPLDITYEELKHKIIISSLSISQPLPISSPAKIKQREVLDTDNECESPLDSMEHDSPLNHTTIYIEDDEENLEDDEEISNGDVCISENIDCEKILIMDFSKENFNFFDNFSTIESIGELFQDLQYVRNQFHPMNNEQAITASAIVKHRDLTKTSHPLQEFKYYEEHIMTKDTRIREFESHNPHFIDLYIYFNPYLPKSLYHKKDLDHHLQLFSYPTYQFIGMQSYEILQELYLEENFHLGWHPTIINLETPIDLDRISDLKNEEIICYGIRDEMMNATTWKELYLLFKNMNLFINPFEKNNIFSTNKIERLNKLGKWILSPSIEHRYLFLDYEKETLDIIRVFVELLESMLLFQKSEFEMFKEYNLQYISMNKDQKDNIKMTIDRLFELIMFMRGWKVNQPYPISDVPPSDNDITEKNTLEALEILDESNITSKNFIYSLPLIIWKNEFVKSQMEDQGLTIGERISIVKNGESDNINSCIRMTSNVLGASYCFYCKLLKIPQKFDIKDLSYIQ